MKTRVLGLSLLVSACATLPPPIPSGRIVFVSSRSGNGDIYMADADGSDIRRLTTDDRPELMPRCSPDGRFLAFVRGTTASGDLYRLDLRDGSELRLTDDATRNSTPEWSRDGRRIYFTKRAGKFDRIAVINADGSGLRYLTDGANHDVMPGISPDGRHIVHHTYRYGKETELHVLDVEAGTSVRLTSHPGSDYEAVFAGDDAVVFSSKRDASHYRLYRQTLTNGAVSLLADTGADAWSSRYSPKRREVLFHTGKPGAWRLMRVPSRGGASPQLLLPDGHSNQMADWC